MKLHADHRRKLRWGEVSPNVNRPGSRLTFLQTIYHQQLKITHYREFGTSKTIEAGFGGLIFLFMKTHLGWKSLGNTLRF